MAATAPAQWSSSSGLPSYQEATRKTDWWAVVAPSVPVKAYPGLCLVSKLAYSHFAPRLWNDPLQMVKLLGMDRQDELSWYLWRFLGRSVKIARLSTRHLVLSLDFRDFASATADFLSDSAQQSLNETLRRLPTLFPSLRCILLDGHPVLDPLALARSLPHNENDAASSSGGGSSSSSSSPLRLLSVAGCANTELPTSYFASKSMTNLVYLDVSYLSGSLGAAIEQGSFGHQTLPNLRVLRGRGREMDNATALLLAEEFRHQLWSLDLSDNSLGDAAILGIVGWGLPPGVPPVAQSLPARFAVEGKQVQASPPSLLGSDEYGPFVSVVESEWSALFAHPHRHLADAPSYDGPSDSSTSGGPGAPNCHTARGVAVAESSEGIMMTRMRMRTDGTTQVLHDGPLALVRALAGGAGRLAPELVDVLASRPCQGFRGITHLSVGGNPRLTLAGVERALRTSGGLLEHFDCDMVLMQIPSSSWSPLPKWFTRSCKVYGVVGISHLLRPVVSTNLRSLRMHHSLVTHTPTIATEGATSLTDSWMAEACFGPRAGLAFPQPFVPDMNPRINSVTLTNIPRRSAGHITERLVRFLELAYEQERAIGETAVALAGSRRSPVMLKGLRHFRLEFEADPVEQLEGSSADDESYDPGSVMDQPAAEFSFFGEWKPSSRAEEPVAGSRLGGDGGSGAETAPSPRKANPTSSDVTGTHSQVHGLSDAANGEYIHCAVPYHGKSQTVPVWVGPGEQSPHPAVNEYMKNLRDASLRSGGVGPATPSQVLAGVPAGSFLFQDAWMAILAPPSVSTEAPNSVLPSVQQQQLKQQQHGQPLRKPTRQELSEMRDVVAELKRYRQEARVSGRHWTGKLEVECKEHDTAIEESSHASQFWR